jgi:hypothetical protein
MMPKRRLKGNKIKYRGIVGGIFKIEMHRIWFASLYLLYLLTMLDKVQ